MRRTRHLSIQRCCNDAIAGCSGGFDLAADCGEYPLQIFRSGMMLSCAVAEFSYWDLIQMPRSVIAFRLAVAALALTGCGEHQQRQAKANLDVETQACEAEFPKIVGNYVHRIYCLSNAINKYNSVIRSQNRDIDELFLANIMSVGIRVDQGQVSPAEYDVQVARFKVENNNEAQRRSSQAAAAQAAQAAALLPLWQAQQANQLNTLHIQPYQMPLPNPPANTMTHCTSNAIGQTVYTNCH